MKKLRVRIDFSNYSDPALVTKVQAIIQAMSASTAIFPDPNPDIVALGQATTAYTVALAKAASREKTLVLLKDEKRAELELMMATLAAYVVNIANNDPAIVSASGYDIIPPANPKDPIDAPKNPSIIAGVNTGEIDVVIERVKGAISYNYQITPEPLTETSHWDTRASSLRKYTFSELEPGKKYWFRVAALGPRNQVTYSNALFRVAA